MDTANEGTKTADPIAAIDAFLNRSELEVRLTYAFAPTAIVFPCRLILNDDELAARQAFYLKPEAEREAAEFAYHVEMLTSILSAKPSGLPGFDELLAANGDKYKSTLKSYLNRGGPVAKMIAADAIELYNRMIKPAEFFR